MSETRYMISDTAKKVDVEAHVLRYWEEELEIEISRTELGHRYYTEDDIRLFRKIRELKERGLQLKAIKVLIPELRKHREDDAAESLTDMEQEAQKQFADMEQERKAGTQETLPALGPDPDRLAQFEHIVIGLFRQVVQENNAELEGRITDSLTKEINLLLAAREEREEERFRRLDETIRAYQKNRQLAAATKEPERKKRFLFF